MKRALWVVLGASLWFSARARAEEATVLAARDNTIFENGAGLSNGFGTGLFAGPKATGPERRALLFFDVAAAVPAGATITKVTLKLALTRTRGGSTTLGLHRLNAQWGEGDSIAVGEGGGGGAAHAADATWSHRIWPDQMWSREGGDFVDAPSATVAVGGLQTYAWSSAALVQDVQQFLDHPEDNRGWILLAESDAGTAKRFASRESQAGNGPQLVVSFTPPSTPFGACCLPDGSCGFSLDPGGSCQGNYLGAGTSCGPGVCPEPTGACCTPDAKATCAIVKRSACSAEFFQGTNSTCDPNPCAVILTPFVDELPLPAPAVPVEGASGAAATYRMSMVQTQQQLHRDLPPTTVWGYSDGKSGGYPGPTIEAKSGAPVSVTWVNDLRDDEGALLKEHPLAIDHCLHGAHGDAPRTVVHLHGGHVASKYDGQPEQTLMPGEEVRYEYPNEQRAATIWYHDHAVGITRLNVYMGLAGFYLVRDDAEKALGLPSGEFEVPLAIQDRSFFPDGRLRYPEKWQESFFGDNAVVNGKVSPYLTVKRGKYRFRILNGSTSRAYTLSLSNNREFWQIGNDGGLLRRPVSVKEISITPGERADIIIDFASAAAEVILKNSALSPFPAGGARARPLTDILKFKVVDGTGSYDPVPDILSRPSALDESEAVMSRDFTIAPAATTHCGYNMWLINELEWDDITERPQLGTTEVWRFINQSGVTHPMHMHSLFFQVLDRQAIKFSDGEWRPDGDPEAPNPGELGWKDTVQVGPFEAVRVIARFEDYAGRFPYHCHLVEHEDHGMMRQFEVQSSCGDGAVEKGVEQCDDGNKLEGDGCDSKCQKERDPTASLGCRLGRQGTDAGIMSALLIGLALWWSKARRRARERKV